MFGPPIRRRPLRTGDHVLALADNSETLCTVNQTHPHAFLSDLVYQTHPHAFLSDLVNHSACILIRSCEPPCMHSAVCVFQCVVH